MAVESPPQLAAEDADGDRQSQAGMRPLVTSSQPGIESVRHVKVRSESSSYCESSREEERHPPFLELLLCAGL